MQFPRALFAACMATEMATWDRTEISVEEENPEVAVDREITEWAAEESRTCLANVRHHRNAQILFVPVVLEYLHQNCCNCDWLPLRDILLRRWLRHGDVIIEHARPRLSDWRFLWRSLLTATTTTTIIIMRESAQWLYDLAVSIEGLDCSCEKCIAQFCQISESCVVRQSHFLLSFFFTCSCHIFEFYEPVNDELHWGTLRACLHFCLSHQSCFVDYRFCSLVANDGNLFNRTAARSAAEQLLLMSLQFRNGKRAYRFPAGYFQTVVCFLRIVFRRGAVACAWNLRLSLKLLWNGDPAIELCFSFFRGNRCCNNYKTCRPLQHQCWKPSKLLSSGFCDNNASMTVDGGICSPYLVVFSNSPRANTSVRWPLALRYASLGNALRAT